MHQHPWCSHQWNGLTKTMFFDRDSWRLLFHFDIRQIQSLFIRFDFCNHCEKSARPILNMAFKLKWTTNCLWNREKEKEWVWVISIENLNQCIYRVFCNYCCLLLLRPIGYIICSQKYRRSHLYGDLDPWQFFCFQSTYLLIACGIHT